jgi:hypothetical protein
MVRRLDPLSTGILGAALIVAVPEAARAHWFSAVMSVALGLLLLVAVRQVQRSLYFYKHPDELAAWQAAPPPPPGFRSGRRLQLWCWATWPPQDEQRRIGDSNPGG